MAIVTYTEQIVFERRCCANCGIVYAISEHYTNRLRESHATFYCPNGHAQHFPQDNEAEGLRKELKRKEQELSDIVGQKITIENELNAVIKKSKRDLKRLTNGVCPCCNRTFSNLHNHMKKQHPDHIVN